MKIFIRNIFGFTIFVIINAFLLQAFLSIRIKNKSITGHDNLEQTNSLNADLVFLGSSRCRAHFDPFFFENKFHIKCVNIGVDGHSEISMAILRLKTYLLKNKNPKYVVLSLDPFMSGGSFTDNANMSVKNAFARYSFWPKEANLMILNYFKFNWYEKYIPLYSIFKYNLLSDCLRIKDNNYTRFGYDRHDELWNTNTYPKTNNLTKNYFSNEQLPVIKEKLIELNTLCFENNIKLLCIQTPVYELLYSDNFFKRTSSVCHELNLSFIETNKINIQSNQNNFYNSNHMNKFGVEKMNEELIKDTAFRSFLAPLK